MKLLTFTALLAALPCGQEATRLSFEGTWLRDEVVGKNGKPSPQITWKITLDETAITLVESSEKGVPTRTPKYKLDGSEASYTVKNRPDAHTTKLIRRPDRLIEVSEIMPSVDGASMKISETWELTNGGKTLKVIRKFQVRSKDGPLGLA